MCYPMFATKNAISSWPEIKSDQQLATANGVSLTLTYNYSISCSLHAHQDEIGLVKRMFCRVLSMRVHFLFTHHPSSSLADSEADGRSGGRQERCRRERAHGAASLDVFEVLGSQQSDICSSLMPTQSSLLATQSPTQSSVADSVTDSVVRRQTATQSPTSRRPVVDQSPTRLLCELRKK